MKQILFLMTLLFCLPAHAQKTMESDGHAEIRQEFQVAAEAILYSDAQCTHNENECHNVDPDYPYPYRERYDTFLNQMSQAVGSVHIPSDADRHSLIATLLAVSWAESTWGVNSRLGAYGECGPLQIISCEFPQWRERGIQCSDDGYVDTNTRPTCGWLLDPSNSLTWFMGHWEARPGPAEYNGCSTDECVYALKFESRYNAAITALH